MLTGGDPLFLAKGGPGMVDVLDLLKGADFPWDDQRTFLKAIKAGERTELESPHVDCYPIGP